MASRPLRRLTPMDRGGMEPRNRQLLAAYAKSEDATSRLYWRNRLVEANLGLVHSVAARFAPMSQLPFADLAQVGSQGLIRAVEAFDGRKAQCLSTFAVPYVRGAIQHELRDRESWIRPPRRLWELRQRARGIQEKRRGEGSPPLGRQELAAALTCAASELDEAEGLRAVSQPLSLDALQCRSEEEGSGSWLDQLADPRSLGEEEGVPPPDPQCRAQRLWLRGELDQLDPVQRGLVLGRVLVGCTWVELGREFGLHPRMAERRFGAALRRLRASAEVWERLGA